MCYFLDSCFHAILMNEGHLTWRENSLVTIDLAGVNSSTHMHTVSHDEEL